MFRYSFAICWRAARWCLRCCRYVSFSFLLFYLFKLLDRRKNCFIVERISCRHRLNRKKKKIIMVNWAPIARLWKKSYANLHFQPPTKQYLGWLIDQLFVLCSFSLPRSLHFIFNSRIKAFCFYWRYIETYFCHSIMTSVLFTDWNRQHSNECHRDIFIDVISW